MSVRVETFAPVERIPAPSRAEFERDFVRASRPVVLTGLLDAWPARTRWTLDYLRARCGDRQVPAAATHAGMLNHDPGAGIVYGRVTLGRFVDDLRAEPPPALYVTCSLEELLPELMPDVAPFEYTEGARWTRRRIWLGPTGTASPMHRDLPENLYAQFVGRKRMILFPREESRRMYPHPFHSSLPNFGQVDAENPDMARFPAFGGAYGSSVILEPGDVLYLPSRWWHQARTLDTSLSLNLWWAPGRPLAALLRLAEAYKRARGLSL